MLLYIVPEKKEKQLLVTLFNYIQIQHHLHHTEIRNRQFSSTDSIYLISEKI